MMNWVASHSDWLSIEALPGYAPDLNPTEQVWGSMNAENWRTCAQTPSQSLLKSPRMGCTRIGSDAPLCLAFLRHTRHRL